MFFFSCYQHYWNESGENLEGRVIILIVTGSSHRVSLPILKSCDVSSILPWHSAAVGTIAGVQVPGCQAQKQSGR